MIKVVAKDNGGTANGGRDTSAPQTFTITIDPVNDAPVNQLPQQQSVAENNVLTFSSANSNRITVSDVDASSAVVEVALTVNNGVLTVTGDGTYTGAMSNGTILRRSASGPSGPRR